jgi:SPW repeat
MRNGWIIGIAGIWAFIAPFTGLSPAGYAWSHWIVGVIAAVIGFSMAQARPTEGWITGVLGVWMFIAGFIGGLLDAPGVWWNNLLVGAALAVFGFAAMRTTRPVTSAGAKAR